MATVVKAIFTVTGDTTENWAKYPKFVPNKNELIVYTDMDVITDQNGKETKIPGIKVGDGNAYLSDLPFVGTKAAKGYYDTDSILKAIKDHENNKDIHVTVEEKEKWNNKLNFKVKEETLTFTTD